MLYGAIAHRTVVLKLLSILYNGFSSLVKPPPPSVSCSHRRLGLCRSVNTCAPRGSNYVTATALRYGTAT